MSKLNESRRMYEWVVSQKWKSHVTLMCSRSSASCRKYKWVMSPWMRHVEHTNESCHLDVLIKLLLCPLFLFCLQLCYFFSLTLALARLPCRLSSLNDQPLLSLEISYSWSCCPFYSTASITNAISSTTASITNNTTNGSSFRVTWLKYVLVQMTAYMWIYVCTYRDKCMYACPCICVCMCDMDGCIHICVWVHVY